MSRTRKACSNSWREPIVTDNAQHGDVLNTQSAQIIGYCPRGSGCQHQCVLQRFGEGRSRASVRQGPDS